MPWPFSPPIPTAKSILVDGAIYRLTVNIEARDDLAQQPITTMAGAR
jgi:hypothetical protein